ncbi:hypothetical protein Vadar_002030 [Vaccinium darrowii]|uniref:Uncharacterized protein n=1 Tax=Vaccinium darrowii TaxID=229202 RepID=A0ACB7ZA03_9ERIC|nr:hypothetical protein Vadar_002030 [Vaccinium darrowii]
MKQWWHGASSDAMLSRFLLEMLDVSTSSEALVYIFISRSEATVDFLGKSVHLKGVEFLSQRTNSYRWCPTYVDGVRDFMRVASHYAGERGRIRCPCRNCNNVCILQLSQVKQHLFLHGILEDYSPWIHHGEPSQLHVQNLGDESCQVDGRDDQDENPFNDVAEMLSDLHRGTFSNASAVEGANSNQPLPTVLEGEVEKFDRLLRDAKSELYPGCEKYSKLSFLVKMLHLKTTYNCSNKLFNEQLKLFKDALPSGETLPSSYYEAKKLMRDLGLGYISIHACPNNCVLFWKENNDLQECPNPDCRASRWKHDPDKRKKVPQKVLRYLPIKPRLQRLFMNVNTAEDMRWHKEKRIQEENKIRHPAEAKAWQEFDKEHEWFARDPRNVRLGLASDGFNPFGSMSNSYSMWPVVLMPYNLPPWKCMKEQFFMMSLLIPGPESPGNDIDVYLRPLIDELKELWETGVETYDAYSGETFQLHAAVLWTINDFPAYGMLSGWSTKGKLACPICNKDTCSLTLKHGQKQCYMGHRRYLDHNHVWRRSKKFDGKQEYRSKPKILSGEDILRQLIHVSNVIFGKAPNKRKRKRREQELNWTKKSIFFELPYWRTLKLRHNLDVMHIEKNIMEILLGTLLNTEGKTKDNVKARMDLELMGIRKELHLQQAGDKFLIPQACYTLSLPERKKFCEWFSSVKLPDGYASNLSRCVNVKDGKISGMKSHDYHVFLQRLLPIAAHGFLRKDVHTVLSELSHFFNQLCSKTVDKVVLKKLKKDIAVILCKLEMIYPPSFFVVMVHLAIHLPREVELGGPVQYRWMYPVERFLCTLKKFVRNKARPEGSIVEAYADEECLIFCSMYLRGIETRFNKQERNYDGCQADVGGNFSVFIEKARPLGAATYNMLSTSDLKKVTWYVLHNCREIDAHLTAHKEELKRESPINVQQRHEENFASWFGKHVARLRENGSLGSTDKLYVLGLGPDPRVTRYGGIVVNGVRFQTVERDKFRRTQNSGIVVKGENQGGETDFYGVLVDIIELQYCHGNRVFLFKCDWWDTGNKKTGIKKDGHLTSVNISRKWYREDPFVLATQVEQVFYINDVKNGGKWQVVQKTCPRNVFDVSEKGKNVDGGDNDEVSILNDEPYQQFVPINANEVEQVDDRDMSPLNRTDVCSEHVDANVILSRPNSSLLDDNFSDDATDEEDDTIIDYNTDEASDQEDVEENDNDNDTDEDSDDDTS